MDYQEILDFAYGLAEKLVTETDQAVEEMIKTAVADRYPSHKFIGEESYAAGDRPPLTDEYTWIVDPIDGTMNPSVACSIGVAHNSRPVVGVIALPFSSQIFSARLGGGATLNRTTPLPLTGGIPQPLTELSRCMIGAEWGSDRSAVTFAAKSASFVRLAGDPSKGVERGVMAHALRTTGSTACNVAAIAAGHLDVYWDAGCFPWDVCAGAVIVHEVGGLFSGGKDTLDSPMAEILMGRRYIFIRALPSTQTESAVEIQRRLVRTLYDVVDEWTNEDM